MVKIEIARTLFQYNATQNYRTKKYGNNQHIYYSGKTNNKILNKKKSYIKLTSPF